MINCQARQYGQQGFEKAFAPFTFQLQAQILYKQCSNKQNSSPAHHVPS
jgi:hypothetical protein